MGILKNTKNVFTRYKNPYLSLDSRFLKPDNKSAKREEDIYAAFDNTTMKNVLKYLRAKGLAKIVYLDNNITGIIDRFTDDSVTDDELNKVILGVKERHSKAIVDIVMQDRDTITIKLKDRDIEASRLTHTYPKVAEYYPAVLTMESRKGNCHAMSIAIASGLDDDTIIATGSMYHLTPRAKFLHSWVEETRDGVEYCHDYTYNLSIKKQDYYSLFHIKPYEKIPAKQYRQDVPYVARLIDKDITYAKMYLSSREEALKLAKTLPEVDYDLSKT